MYFQLNLTILFILFFIGVLANAFVEELIVRVSSVEDIPANTAVQLTTFFKIVTDKIPQLFEASL